MENLDFSTPAAIKSYLGKSYLHAWIKTGDAVRTVVDIEQKQGFARIQREDGRRRIDVTAEIDVRRTRPQQIQAALLGDGLPDIAARHNVDYEFAGRAEDQRQARADQDKHEDRKDAEVLVQVVDEIDRGDRRPGEHHSPARVFSAGVGHDCAQPLGEMFAFDPAAGDGLDLNQYGGRATVS